MDLRRPHLAITALSAALLGCGPGPARAPAHAPTAAPPTSAPAGPAKLPTALTVPPGPAACRRTAGPVLTAPSADLVCKHQDRFSSGSCQGKSRITVTNCGHAPIRLRSILLKALDQRPGHTVTYEGGPIPPGGVWARTYEATLARRYAVSAKLESGAALPGVTLVFKNPTLEAAKRRCRDCNGDFGARGMLSIVSCACRMPDAGKACTDGDQCQGKCVSTPAGFRCSKHSTVFGCHSYLPRGWSRQRPPPGLSRTAPQICVD